MNETEPEVLWLVLASAAVQAVQVLATDYGTGSRGAGVVWFVVGLVLVAAVYRRRSSVARTVFVVISALSALIYLSAAVHDAGQALVGLLFLAQAVPLVLPPVNRHVHVAAPAAP